MQVHEQRVVHLDAKIVPKTTPRSAKRPKITYFWPKNAPFCCKNANLPNHTCFTRIPRKNEPVVLGSDSWTQSDLLVSYFCGKTTPWTCVVIGCFPHHDSNSLALKSVREVRQRGEKVVFQPFAQPPLPQTRRLLATCTHPSLQRNTGCNKNRCFQMHANADKRLRTQTNADVWLSETGPSIQTNGHKRKEKREQTQNEELHPLFTPPFAAAQILL